MKANVNVTASSLETLCQRWKVASLAVFGSALRDDFGPQSDIDLLVSFAKDADWTLFDLVTMQDELEQMLGREVDLVEREAVEHRENYARRRNILLHTETIYTREYAPQVGFGVANM